MAIQFLRGNTSANDSYTGPVGSLTVDTEMGTIRVHDGNTAGGWTIANVDESGTISSISGTSPIVISGTTSDPVIEIQSATQSQDGSMSSADKSKLDGIESGAEANAVDSVNGQTGSVDLSSDEVSEGSSNLYFTASRAQGAISVSGDLTYSNGEISFNETYSTASEVKSAYESNSDTNAFTDSEKSKLGGVESGAEANTVDSVNGQTGAVSIPNADSSKAGLVSTGDQTFSGNKTFSGIVTIDEGAI